MLISGLQKLSLSDYPGKLACVVFCGGCNLRCPYCHNAEIITNPPVLMKDEEFFDFLETKKGKLDGVCISGGEPCIHAELVEFARKIKSMGFLLKLDTNAFYFDRLKELNEQVGLDYIAIDIKNDPSHYEKAVGINVFDDISKEIGENCKGAKSVDGKAFSDFKKTLSYVINSGVDYEFRTTLVKQIHNEDSICGIRDFLKTLLNEGGKVPHYYLQSFVDRETVPYGGLEAPTDQQLQRYVQILREVAEYVEIR